MKVLKPLSKWLSALINSRPHCRNALKRAVAGVFLFFGASCGDCSWFPVVAGVVSLAFDGAAYFGSGLWSGSHSKSSLTLVFSWEVAHPEKPWSDSLCEVPSVSLNSESQNLPCSGAAVHVPSLEVVEDSKAGILVVADRPESRELDCCSLSIDELAPEAEDVFNDGGLPSNEVSDELRARG